MMIGMCRKKTDFNNVEEIVPVEIDVPLIKKKLEEYYNSIVEKFMENSCYQRDVDTIHSIVQFFDWLEIQEHCSEKK